MRLSFLFLSASVFVLTLSFAGSSRADSIQMLPPTSFAGAACSFDDNTYGMLQWDGKTSIKCVPGFYGLSDGSLGIGTVSPTAKLHVADRTRALGVKFSGKSTVSGGHDHVSDILLGENIQTGKAWDFAVRGPSDPYNPNGLIIAHFSNALGNGDYANMSNWVGGLNFDQRGNLLFASDSVGRTADAKLGVTGSERMASNGWSKAIAIDPAGAIIWKSFNPSNTNGNNFFMSYPSSANPPGHFFAGFIKTLDGNSFTDYMMWVNGDDADGDYGMFQFKKALIVNGTNYPSDSRLKKDVHPISGALDSIAKINGVTFNWKDETKGKGEQIGVIAQDVEKVLPQIVFTGNEGMKSVDYAKLTPVLVEAVKELKETVDQLKAENEKLSQEVKALKNSAK